MYIFKILQQVCDGFPLAVCKCGLVQAIPRTTLVHVSSDIRSIRRCFAKLPLQQEDQQFPMPQVECLKAAVVGCDSIEQPLQGLCSAFNQIQLQGSSCKVDWSSRRR